MDNKDQGMGDSSGDVRQFVVDNDHPTETINLKMLFPSETTIYAADDLGTADRSDLSKLLSALSVPTLLISRSHAIKFANPAFKRISDSHFNTTSAMFSSLFPNPMEARQAQLLLEKVFKERKPEIRETVLQIHRTRIWARLHLLTVRIEDQPMVLLQIENLTAQKQLLTVQKYKKLVNIFPMGIVELATPRPLKLTLSVDTLLTAILDSRVVDGNNEFANMYKRRGITDLKGVRLGMLFPSKGGGQWLY